MFNPIITLSIIAIAITCIYIGLYKHDTRNVGVTIDLHFSGSNELFDYGLRMNEYLEQFEPIYIQSNAIFDVEFLQCYGHKSFPCIVRDMLNLGSIQILVNWNGEHCTDSWEYSIRDGEYTVINRDDHPDAWEYVSLDEIINDMTSGMYSCYWFTYQLTDISI